MEVTMTVKNEVTSLKINYYNESSNNLVITFSKMSLTEKE